MRHLLISTAALAVVMWAGMMLSATESASTVGATSPQIEAGVRAYCRTPKALLGHVYLASSDRACRSARRLFA